MLSDHDPPAFSAYPSGVSKAFHFDDAFHRFAPSGDSSGDTRLRLGVTMLGQRRFRDPAPASYAFAFAPSASYRITADWSASLAVEATRRWFDRNDRVSQRNFTLEPVAAVEYQIPERWLGGEKNASRLGRPAFDVFGGVERAWSNVESASFTRVYGGIALRTRWSF